MEPVGGSPMDSEDTHFLQCFTSIYMDLSTRPIWDYCVHIPSIYECFFTGQPWRSQREDIDDALAGGGDPITANPLITDNF